MAITGIGTGNQIGSVLSRMKGGKKLLPYVSPPAPGVQSKETLPQNYNFNDLAGYEQTSRANLGERFQDQIRGLGRELADRGSAARSGLESRYAGARTGLESDLSALRGGVGSQFAGARSGLESDLASLRGDVGSLASQRSGSVLDYVGDFGQRSSDRRRALEQSLMRTGQQTFEQATPFLLEDLNRRGLFTSESAVTDAAADKLKEIALQNQDALLGYDLSTYGTEDRLREQALGEGLGAYDPALASQAYQGRRGLAGQELGQMTGLEQTAFQSRQGLAGQELGDLNDFERQLFETDSEVQSAALSARQQAEQDALDAGMDMRRAKLEGDLAMQAAIREQAAARDIAKQNRQTGLSGSLGTAGTMAGATLGGPLGAVAGGALGTLAGNVFCFDPSTPVKMADGTTKAIRHIEPGEETAGGKVLRISQALTDYGTKYDYKGVVVTGLHAVKEDGVWKRVQATDRATPVPGDGMVYALTTSKHRIYVGDIEFADDVETDDYEHLTITESLERLNQEERYGVQIA